MRAITAWTRYDRGMTDHVTVLATIKVKAGLETEAATLLHSIVAPTLEEPGCLEYALHRSLTDPTTFVFVERWDSDAALAAHAASTAPHRLALRERIGALIDGAPSVTRWRPMGI
jgi:quinol monooxygenase YgiN